MSIFICSSRNFSQNVKYVGASGIISAPKISFSRVFLSSSPERHLINVINLFYSMPKNLLKWWFFNQNKPTHLFSYFLCIYVLQHSKQYQVEQCFYHTQLHFDKIPNPDKLFLSIAGLVHYSRESIAPENVNTHFLSIDIINVWHIFSLALIAYIWWTTLTCELMECQIAFFPFSSVSSDTAFTISTLQRFSAGMDML